MAWIELHQSLRDHPKVIKLSGLMGCDDDDLVRAKLENLWLWTLDYRDSGDLTGLTAVEIAKACRVRWDPELWLSSLIEARFIDTTSERAMHVHDWHDFAGKLIDARARNKQRMQRARATHVTNTCGATVPTVPTVPTQPTEPKNGARAEHVSNTASKDTEWEISSDPVGILAQCYLKQNPGIISAAKVRQQIEFIIASGVPFAKCESAIMNASKGKKIWELLDPLRPASVEQVKTWKELIKGWDDGIKRV